MSEARRIVGVPIVGQSRPVPKRIPEHWRQHLWPTQQRALDVLAGQAFPKGIYVDVPVGGGKFLIGLLSAYIAGAKRPVMMTEPSLVRQGETEIAKFLPMFPEIEGHIPQLLAYTTLSNKKHHRALQGLQPDLLILDEAHNLADRTSARTKRFLAYMGDNWEKCRVIVMSGTLHKKSISATAHLAMVALREDCWLPMDTNVLYSWAQVLDHNAVSRKEHRVGFFKDIVRWAKNNGDPFCKPTSEGCRRAVRMRYLTTPGVVAPKPRKVPAALTIRTAKLETPETVQAAMERLEGLWELPDGTEIVDALELHRHARTLSTGFYYRPIWPPGSWEWRQERTAWSRALRRQLHYIQGHDLDSMARVIDACEEGTAHPHTVAAWQRWKPIKDDVEPKSEVVWLDESIIKAEVGRALQTTRAILWYSSARAVEPLLKRLSLPTYGAGTDPPSDDVTHAALSIAVHGTGKNLQAWPYQIILELPSNAEKLEQLLGRAHRGEQKHNVVVDTLLPSNYLKMRFTHLTNEAKALSGRGNNTHKVLIAQEEKRA